MIIKRNFFTLFVLISTLFIVGCQFQQETEKPFSHYYTEGEKALLIEDYETGLDFYLKGLAIMEDTPEAVDLQVASGILYFNIGYCHEQMNQIEDAVTYYSLAIEDESSEVIAYIALGGLRFRQELYDQSQALFLKAIEIDDKAYEAYVNLSAIYALREDAPMALSLLTKAIHVDKERPDAYLNRAYLFASIGDEDMMKQDIQVLKAMNFSSLDVYIKIFNDTLEKGQL